jgi:hypothetical protein
VCRVSGQLPNDGCTSVEVVGKDGSIETRSMVYTEYCVKGTQPNTVCPLHPSRSFMDRLAGFFGKDSGTSIDQNQVGLPGTGTSTPPPVPPAASAVDPGKIDPKKEEKTEKADEGKKKPGFWSRLFGKGQKKDTLDDKKKKPGGGG